MAEVKSWAFSRDVLELGLSGAIFTLIYHAIYGHSQGMCWAEWCNFHSDLPCHLWAKHSGSHPPHSLVTLPCHPHVHDVHTPHETRRGQARETKFLLFPLLVFAAGCLLDACDCVGEPVAPLFCSVQNDGGYHCSPGHFQDWRSYLRGTLHRGADTRKGESWHNVVAQHSRKSLCHLWKHIELSETIDASVIAPSPMALLKRATGDLACKGVECFRLTFVIMTIVSGCRALVSLLLVFRTRKFYSEDIYTKFRLEPVPMRGMKLSNTSEVQSSQDHIL
ncbi:hypothetical protein GOP47_0028444 [Adiantum capillus-veneris]|nr:hypothetical protein GOP47_0028444 [Adiantum capillus-veneris]